MKENATKTLPEILNEKIQAKDLDVEKLSQLTGISERYITLLTEGHYDKLPAAPYVHGYLLKIAEILDLKGEEIWKEYLRNVEDLRRSGANDKLPHNRFVTNTLAKKIIIIAIILTPIIAIVSFRFFYYPDNPNIEFNNLEEDITIVSDSSYTITGTLDPNYSLFIGNEKTYLDNEGNFEREILLDEGFNAITFRAKKVLGKEHVISKQIFYQPPAPIEVENKTDDANISTSTKGTTQ